MATEFNYVVNVDTTRVMGAMAEVRSQMGMAFGGPGAGMGPGVAPAEPSAFGGAASRAWGMMQSGLARGMGRLGGIGRTFTDERIAYDPHYGMVQAETNLQQEWQVQRFGLQAAARMRPPGVSAFDYAMNVQRNAVDRRLEANYQAFAAGRSTLLSGAAGLGAGELAYVAAGAPIGAAVGGRLATRWGLGAGAGRMVGGVLGGLGAFMLAEQYVGGKIRGHYAEVAQTRGIMRELGDIAGAGRGLTRLQQADLGISAYRAAKDIGIDANQMGDVIALGRQAGLLPETTDPAKARQQFGEFAKAIDEGAQMLRTSLANATQVIKHMAGRGYGAEEGILQFIGEQATPGLAQMRAFGAEGAGVARANFLRGQQGFNLFTAGVRQAAGAGMDPEVLGMMGGKFGAGRMIAMTQMQAALSPMGDLQLMAAQGGAPLGGLYETGAAALGVAAEGGDMIGNMLRFEATKDQIRRGIGAKGIRTMAMQQIQGHAEMLMDIAPSMSMREARVSAAQQRFGMTGDQARMFVSGGVAGGGAGGAGGISGEGRVAQLEAYQGMMLGRAGIFDLERRPEEAAADAGFSFGYTKAGAIGGAAVGWAAGGPIGGAIIGGVGGFVGDVGSFVSRNWDYIGKGPGLFGSAEDKAAYELRTQQANFDRQIQAVKEGYGVIPIDPSAAARVGTAPLQQAWLDADRYGPAAAARMGNVIGMAGIQPVGFAGPGTTVIGGVPYSTAAVRRGARALEAGPEISEATKGLAYGISVLNFDELSGAQFRGGDARRAYRRAYTDLAEKGATAAPETREKWEKELRAAEAAMVAASPDEGLRQLYENRGTASPKELSRLQGVFQLAAGGTRWKPPKVRGAYTWEISAQGAMAKHEQELATDLEVWLRTAAEDRPAGGVGPTVGREQELAIFEFERETGYGGDYLRTIGESGQPADYEAWMRAGGARSFQRYWGEKMHAKDPKTHRGIATPGAKLEYWLDPARAGERWGALPGMEAYVGLNMLADPTKGYVTPSMAPRGTAFTKALAGNKAFLTAIEAEKWAVAEKEVQKLSIDYPRDVSAAGGPKGVIERLQKELRPTDIGRGDPEVTRMIEEWNAEAAAARKDPSRFMHLDPQGGQGIIPRAIREATEPKKLSSEIAGHLKVILDLGKKPHRKRRRRRPRMAERAVGFGQREQAMTTINRALKSTFRQLKNHERRISKTPTTESANPAKSGVEG